MKEVLHMALAKLVLGIEGRGAFVVWVLMTVLWLFIGAAQDASALWSMLGIALAIIFARYPDLDIPFHLLRRELLRRVYHFKTLSDRWASREVTALITFLTLASLTIVPLIVLDVLGAHFDAWVYIALLIGCVVGVVRAWFDHDGRLGAHWIYGHYPLLLLPAAYAIGHGVGEVIGVTGWYFGAVCALCAAWHFMCDAMQENLGVPWLGPLYVGRHMTACGTIIDPKQYFREEIGEYYDRFGQSWFDELIYMAEREGGEHH